MKRIKQWMRVRLAYLLGRLPLPQPKVKFVIFGQGRTGSTLLVDLLNSCGDIHCDREIFNLFHFTGEQIRHPAQYVIGRSKRFSSTAYGFKVKVYQLRYDHGIRSPREVLLDLLKEGYKVIYLSRANVLEHAFSNVKRSISGVTHVRGTKNAGARVNVPVSLLINEILDRLRFKAEELNELQGIDHYALVYERDLLDSARHLQTVNGIREYLQLDKVTSVRSQYQKINDRSLADQMSNYDELILALQEERLDHLLETK